MKKPEPELATAAGLHRAVWNLQWDGAEFLEGAKVDSGDTDRGPRAAPGTYRLRLTAAGTSVESALELLPDPRSKSSAADREAQVAFALGVRDAINEVTADIRTVRAIRDQARDVAQRLAGDGRGTDVAALARRLAEECEALEAKLHNPKAKVVYDILAQPGGTQLHSNLVFLYSSSLYGESAPTQGEREVFAELQARMQDLDRELAEIRSGSLAELERQAAEMRLPRILLPQPIEAEDI
jgi:hypothetical protein